MQNHQPDATPIHTAIYNFITSAQRAIDQAEDDISAAHTVLDILPTTTPQTEENPDAPLDAATTQALKWIIEQAQSQADYDQANKLSAERVLELILQKAQDQTWQQPDGEQTEQQGPSQETQLAALQMIKSVSEEATKAGRTAKLNASLAQKVLDAFIQGRYTQFEDPPTPDPGQDPSPSADTPSDRDQPDPVVSSTNKAQHEEDDQSPESTVEQNPATSQHPDGPVDHNQEHGQADAENNGEDVREPDQPTSPDTDIQLDPPQPSPPDSENTNNQDTHAQDTVTQNTVTKDTDAQYKDTAQAQSPQEPDEHTSLLHRLPDELRSMTVHEAATLHTRPNSANLLFTKARGVQPPDCAHCRSTNTRLRTPVSSDNYICSDCHKAYTIKTNTLMNHSNLPLGKWAYAVYLAANNPEDFSHTHLMDKLSVGASTARKTHGAVMTALHQKGDPIANLCRLLDPEPDPQGSKTSA